MKTKVDEAVVLVALLLLSILFAVIAPTPLTPHKERIANKVWYVIVEVEKDVEETEEWGGQQQRVINYYENWYKPNHHSTKTVTLIDIEYEYIGYYYCTAYSPQETGSWGTASGTTLHRAEYEDRLVEPTTCAIDRSLHRFGDLFYIPAFDRVFVAEDTGSAVKGKHLDLGYTDLESVWGFPTGSYEVYSVEYIYTDLEAKCYDFDKENGVRRLVYLKDLSE